jgi:hypothetical protein
MIRKLRVISLGRTRLLQQSSLCAYWPIADQTLIKRYASPECAEKRSSSGSRECLSIFQYIQTQRRPVPSIGLWGSFCHAGSSPTCKLFLPFDYLLSNPAPLPFAHFILLAGLFPLQSTSRQRRQLVRDRCCLRLFGNISSHDHIRPAVFYNVKCLLESLVRPILFMPHCDCH